MKKIKFKTLLIISQVREALLKWILYTAGFKIIRDHWVYVKELTGKSTVIDLGANTGTFSKAIVQEFGSACFAVEPNVTLYNNISIPGITKLNYAVTKNDGPIDFYLSENPEASSVMNNFQDMWAIAEKNTVEGVSWNTLLKKLNLEQTNIDVSKMDVEGAELDIIDSLSAQNLKNIQQITVEFHHRLNPDLHTKTVAAIKKLLTSGFTGIANTITPTEILFIRLEKIKLATYQKVLLALYHNLCFSMY